MTQTLKPAVSPRSGFSDSNVPDQLLADPRACPRVRGWLSPYPPRQSGRQQSGFCKAAFVGLPVGTPGALCA